MIALLITIIYAAFRLRRPWRNIPESLLFKARKPLRNSGPGRATAPKKRSLAALLSNIPKGRVVTFSTLAEYSEDADTPGQIAKRVRELATKSRLPWWRVVRKEGGRATVPDSEAGRRQRKLLEKEGIVFQGESFSLREYETTF